MSDDRFWKVLEYVEQRISELEQQLNAEPSLRAAAQLSEMRSMLIQVNQIGGSRPEESQAGDIQYNVVKRTGVVATVKANSTADAIKKAIKAGVKGSFQVSVADPA